MGDVDQCCMSDIWWINYANIKPNTDTESGQSLATAIVTSHGSFFFLVLFHFFLLSSSEQKLLTLVPPAFLYVK